jgi:hypothetical protein
MPVLCAGCGAFFSAAAAPKLNTLVFSAGSCAFFSAAVAPKLNCGVALKPGDGCAAGVPKDSEGVAPNEGGFGFDTPKDAAGVVLPKPPVGVAPNAPAEGEGAALAFGGFDSGAR